MLAEALDARAIDLAGSGERAVAVEAQAGAPHAPIVDRPVARPGVERQQRAVGADPGHVADAADIHHGERPRQLARERRMIDRHQRRPLPARFHVGDAQVADHLHAGRARQRSAVADLPGEAAFGAMGDRLAVEAHDIDRRQRRAAFPRPALHGVDMGIGHRPLGRCRRFVGLLRAEGRPDSPPHIVGIGHGQEGAERDHALAVGFDQGDVDAVDRGAAHEAKGTQAG